MECHLCEHQADVLAGKYRGWPFNKTPCARCKLKMSSVGTLEYLDTIASDRPPVGEEEEDDGRSADGKKACEWVRALLDLPRGSWDILQMRRRGMLWNEMEERTGLSEEALQRRLRRALARVPALRVLFQGVRIKRMRMRGRDQVQIKGAGGGKARRSRGLAVASHMGGVGA